MVRICCIRISRSFTGFGNTCLLHFGNTKNCMIRSQKCQTTYEHTLDHCILIILTFFLPTEESKIRVHIRRKIQQA